MAAADGATRLRALLAGDRRAGERLVVAPGVFDGMSAHLVRRAGFPAAYASGGAIARSMGWPDLGLVSLTEMTARLEQIVDSAGVPVVADADTGYGSHLNAYRTVKAYARAGVAGLHLEDQGYPKRCGHQDGKVIVAPEEMCARIRAARAAADEAAPDLVVIARSDAIAVEGFESALARARLYAAAGADMLFLEAAETEEQVAAIPRALPVPAMINMFPGGRTPQVAPEALTRFGYRLMIIASDLQRAAIAAMRETLAAIAASGSSAAVLDRLGDLADRDDAVDLAAWTERDRRFRSPRRSED